MIQRTNFLRSPVSLGLFLGLTTTAVHGCGEDGPLGNIAEQCGLVCPAKGFVEGNASISGLASIDSFFGAALDLNAVMRELSADIRAELDAIGASVGVEAGGDIEAGLRAHFAAHLDGGLEIQFQPPRCSASVEATVAAAAECDVDVQPGSASVSCEGSCRAEAGVAVDCGASAELKCTGTAPGLSCEGTCSGSCAVELSAAAECDGTCRGSCTAGGSTMDGFDGRCNGTCEGECVVEMSAGASCSGKCEGSCEYTAPEGGCEASAEAKCEAQAGASIECDAGCEGSVEPPSVSAECQASVEAKASASVECRPPELTLGFRFAAGVDADAQAEFRAWLEGFRGRFAALIALRARANLVVDAAGNLAAAAGGAVEGTVEELSASADLKASIGAVCALAELPAAGEAIASASSELSGQVSASASVFAAVGQ